MAVDTIADIEYPAEGTDVVAYTEGDCGLLAVALLERGWPQLGVVRYRGSPRYSDVPLEQWEWMHVLALRDGIFLDICGLSTPRAVTRYWGGVLEVVDDPGLFAEMVSGFTSLFSSEVTPPVVMAEKLAAWADEQDLSRLGCTALC